MYIFLAFLAELNVAAFAAMAWDKSCAMRGAWRVPERVLFMLALCGGALGGTIGMHMFHHKTLHWYFKYGFPILAALQFAVFAGMWVRL